SWAPEQREAAWRRGGCRVSLRGPARDAGGWRAGGRGGPRGRRGGARRAGAGGAGPGARGGRGGGGRGGGGGGGGAAGGCGRRRTAPGEATAVGRRPGPRP